MTVDTVSDRTQPMAVDFDALMAPIPGDNPAGESLRYEGVYDQIREARREDDPTLPQGVWKTDFKKADWKQVASICLQSLEERSKDLQLGVWLFEAWLNRHGVEGAVGGFRVLAGLCEEFWDDLYPEIEEDDSEARLSPIEWLNNKVSLEFKRASITEGRGGDEPAFSWIDWEAALFSPESRAETTEDEEGDGSARPSRSAILARVGLTGTEFYTNLSGGLQQGAEALERLEEVLTSRCGDDVPSLGEFKETFEGMGAFVKRVLSERRELEVVDEIDIPDEESGQAEPEAESSGEAKAGPVVGAAIRSRAEAYRVLAAAADYLMKTEPHSPTPYLIRRAISWGGMSLADVLKELMKNNADLGTVYALLGIRQSDDS